MKLYSPTLTRFGKFGELGLGNLSNGKITLPCIYGGKIVDWLNTSATPALDVLIQRRLGRNRLTQRRLRGGGQPSGGEEGSRGGMEERHRFVSD